MVTIFWGLNESKNYPEYYLWIYYFKVNGKHVVISCVLLIFFQGKIERLITCTVQSNANVF